MGADSRSTGLSGSFRDDAAKVIQAHGWVWAVSGTAVVAAWLPAVSPAVASKGVALLIGVLLLAAGLLWTDRIVDRVGT